MEQTREKKGEMMSKFPDKVAVLAEWRRRPVVQALEKRLLAITERMTPEDIDQALLKAKAQFAVVAYGKSRVWVDDTGRILSVDPIVDLGEDFLEISDD